MTEPTAAQEMAVSLLRTVIERNAEVAFPDATTEQIGNYSLGLLMDLAHTGFGFKLENLE